jgi:hypothetical protein
MKNIKAGRYAMVLAVGFTKFVMKMPISSLD